jgi:hypothetical protein
MAGIPAERRVVDTWALMASSVPCYELVSVFLRHITIELLFWGPVYPEEIINLQYTTVQAELCRFHRHLDPGSDALPVGSMLRKSVRQ